jgi:hypothetical protein
MTQQVNLLQSEFSNLTFPFFAETLVPALGAIMALLLIIYGYSLWQTWKPERELVSLESSKKSHETLLQELKKRRSNRSPDAVLAAEVQALDKTVGGKNRLLDALASHGLANREGFSEHLLGLARQRVDAVWLKQIKIHNGGRSLVLAGSSLTPEAVPELIEQLGPEPAFVGREFQALLMQVPEEGQPIIDFALSTEREHADGGPSLLDAFIEKISGEQR